nr:DUF2878 domain-containing protein [Variovorax dokdonensis]
MHRAPKPHAPQVLQASDAGGGEPGTVHRIANFVLCQIAWFAAVVGAARGYEAVGCAVVLAVMAWHLALAARPLREAALLLVVTFFGLLAEAAQAHLDAFRYVGAVAPGDQPPLWLVLLWPLLGCMLNVSLRWMRGRYLLAAVCGAIAGPLAFFGGARLGAAQIHDASILWLAQAIGWAALMPLFVAVASRLDGMARPSASGGPS